MQQSAHCNATRMYDEVYNLVIFIFSATKELSRLLTTEEAAEYLRLHPQTVRRLAREERLRAFYSGKQLVFRKEDLEAFLQPVGVEG